MIPYQLVWLIFFLPLISFGIIVFIIRPFVKPESKVAGYTLITALSIAVALSLWTLISVAQAPHHEIAVPDIRWLVIENGVTIHVGLIVDSLTAVMLIVVTIVSLM
ncbi:MAG: NADH-quinone oxidoreductase subunit L, partial [Pseudomonadota bacterium]